MSKALIIFLILFSCVLGGFLGFHLKGPYFNLVGFRLINETDVDVVSVEISHGDMIIKVPSDHVANAAFSDAKGISHFAYQTHDYRSGPANSFRVSAVFLDGDSVEGDLIQAEPGCTFYLYISKAKVESQIRACY